MIPLTQPDFDYITAGPWIASFEWNNGRFEARQWVDLPHAIMYFWDSVELYGEFGKPKAPNRRVIVDARGVTILGAIDMTPTPNPVVSTREIIDLQEQLGAPPMALLTLELEIMWNLHSSE